MKQNNSSDLIKNIIITNFEERNESDKLTDDFIKSELAIVIRHVRIKHSHHMTSKYSRENYYKIKAIVTSCPRCITKTIKKNKRQSQ